MNEQQAIEAVQQIGISPGEKLVVQSDGQIRHPHESSGYSFHTDAWVVTRNYDGSYSAEKLHTPT
jgi:hypothetical protein